MILFKIPLAIKKELRVKTVASYLLIYRPKTLQSNTLNVCDGEFRKNDKQLKLLHIFAVWMFDSVPEYVSGTLLKNNIQ